MLANYSQATSVANQRPSHDRELLIQSLEKSLCEDSGDTCQLGSPGLGQKKSYEAEKKRTAVTGGRRGLDGGNLPFTFARHLRRMDGVSSAMTMTKTENTMKIQRFPL